MALDFYDVLNAATEGTTFTSMSQYEMWAWNYCRGCIHADVNTEDGENCPIVDVSILGYMPAQWTEDGMGYSCSARTFINS